ncbi:Forkhead-associated domain protein [Rhodopirellula maiorica SM1]|uniref:Forkhead-associated domain protein n=1 Tax=Rhodopirellula maiorica SM1 TaxID=1265738 RepID=M5RJJ5_9BACT|nr:FHA domain-containing protein [Rhodopirellula maiorica]EMI19493.1 Forkhead-associated domain protein [Rhodopirellula maiorica SM1]
MTRHQDSTWTIGSDRNCSVVVMDADVKPLHCELRYKDGVFTVLPRQGRVGIANPRSEIHFTNQPRRIVATDRVYLTKELPLPWPSEQDAAAVLTVGRASDCDLRLDYPEVSGRHATLIIGKCGTRVLRDAHSRNGLYVDADFSKRVDACSLNSNQTVYFGSRSIHTEKFDEAKTASLIEKAKTQKLSMWHPITDPSRQSTWMLASAGIMLMLSVLWTIYLLSSSSPDTTPLSDSHRLESPQAVPVPDANTSTEFTALTTVAEPEPPPAPAEPIVVPPAKVQPSKPPKDAASAAPSDVAACTYWVLIFNNETNTYFRLGTAIATGDQLLSTTGSIVHALTMMQQKGYSHPKVVHLDTKQEYTISKSGVLPEFDKRVQASDLLRQQYITQSEAAKTKKATAELDDASLQRAARLVNLAMTAATSADVGWLQITKPIPHVSLDHRQTVRPGLAVDLLDTGFDHEDPFYDASEKVNLEWIAFRVLGQDPEYDGIAGAMRIQATANEVHGLNLLGAPLVRDTSLLGLVVFQSPPDENSAVILEVVTTQTIAAAIAAKSASTP